MIRLRGTGAGSTTDVVEEGAPAAVVSVPVSTTTTPSSSPRRGSVRESVISFVLLGDGGDLIRGDGCMDSPVVAGDAWARAAGERPPSGLYGRTPACPPSHLWAKYIQMVWIWLSDIEFSVHCVHPVTPTDATPDVKVSLNIGRRPPAPRRPGALTHENLVSPSHHRGRATRGRRPGRRSRHRPYRGRGSAQPHTAHRTRMRCSTTSPRRRSPPGDPRAPTSSSLRW